MKRAGEIVAGLAAVVMSAGAAVAEDIPTVVAPVQPPPTLAPMAAPAFDWGGFYVGANGGGFFCDFVYCTPKIGTQIGYNFTVSNFLLGAEAQVGHDTDFFVALLNVRAGVLLGDSTVVYAQLSLLGWPAFPLVFGDTLFLTAGGGVEIGIGQAMSAFAEVKFYSSQGSPRALSTIGINWHPGN